MHNTIIPFPKIKIVLAILFILFLLVLTGWFFTGILKQIKERETIGGPGNTQNTISVAGTGEIWAKPDVAIIDFSVVSERKNVEEALAENTQKMNKIIETLQNKQISKNDLKTTNFNVYPRYEWYEKSDYSFSGKRVLVGYEVRQSLQVKIRDLLRTGEIIQAAIQAGANEVGDLHFIIEKEEELKLQARAQAIKQAKEKARDIAQQLAVRLGKIVSFNENSITPFPYRSSMKSTQAGGADTVQIEEGTNKIEVQVNIVYEIK